VDEMLRYAFWEGLRPSLKDVSGYIFDKHLTFDEFRSELRCSEQYQDRRKKNTNSGKKNSTGTGQVVMSTTHDEESNSGIDEIRGMLHKLTAEVQQLKVDRRTRSQEPYRKQNYKKNYKQTFSPEDRQSNNDMNFQQSDLSILTKVREVDTTRTIKDADVVL
jgi:hypothetical protein